MSTIQNRIHYNQLDGIRAFAIISVMIAHWISWDTENKLIKFMPWTHGVILFFVLSGYLITQILLDQKTQIEEGSKSALSALKIFFARRVLRIFPIYYLLLFWLLYINFEQIHEFFIWLITYTSNILMAIRGDYIGSFNHTWSLAVEEQFYIFWPFTIFFVPRKHVLKTIVICIVFSFLSRCVFGILSHNGIINWMWGAYFITNNMFALGLGALLAYLKSNNNLKGWYNKIANPILLYASVFFYFGIFYLCEYKFQVPYFREVFDENLYAAMCFFIVLRASNNGFTFISKRILENEIIVFTGKISYGLYLYHLFVAGFFWNYIAPSCGIQISNKHTVWFMYLLVTYLTAIASYYFIEKPINGLKRYFKY